MRIIRTSRKRIDEFRREYPRKKSRRRVDDIYLKIPYKGKLSARERKEKLIKTFHKIFNPHLFN